MGFGYNTLMVMEPKNGKRTLNGSVLVLNATFEPINVTTVRRALVLIIKGTARPEELTNRQVHSAQSTFLIPSVIRLTEYIRIPYERKELSRRNVLLRDGYVCQYCGRQFRPAELTIDHVTPRARGGRTSWDNVVTCCRNCNARKGDRLPEEADMKLLKHHRALSWRVGHQILTCLGQQQEAWRKYLIS